MTLNSLLSYNIITFIVNGCLLVAVSIDGSSTTSTPTTMSADSNATSSGPTYTEMSKLYAKLLNDYDTKIRPRKNLSEPVTVNGSFSLTGVLDFDTASQKLSILGYFIFIWTDEMLVWNPLLHGQICEVKFPFGLIWNPSMLYKTSFLGKGKIGDGDNIITALATGRTIWAPEGTYKMICDVNIKFYPFDKQHCELLIYTASTLMSEINIMEFTTSISDLYFKENSEWEIVSIHSERKEIVESHFISIVIVLGRRNQFIMCTIVAPLVFLSILNMGVFIVPVDSGEKGSIAVTIFLSYSVFFSAVSDELPHNSLKMSYIVLYMIILLSLSVVAVVYAYIQSFIFARYANEKVSVRCLRRLMNMHKVSSSKATPSTQSDPAVDIYQNDPKVAPTFVATATENSSMEEGVTWTALLRKLDVAVCIFFFLFIMIASTAFLAFLSCRSST